MVTTFFHVLAGMVALTLNERMQKKLDYTQQETKVLRDYLETLTGTRRIPFTDEQRRKLAIAGKAPKKYGSTLSFISIVCFEVHRHWRTPAREVHTALISPEVQIRTKNELSSTASAIVI